MLEVSRRVEVIICFKEETCKAKYKIINYEIFFFQIRKILEIIVKAPMLLNEEEYRKISKNPEGDWRIKDILDKLKRIDPNYYPEPIKIKKNTITDEIRFFNVIDGYLNEKDLIEAYKYCNTYLHSENPLAGDLEINFDDLLRKIDEIVNKINILLEMHLFKPIGSDVMYTIYMKSRFGVPAGNIFIKQDI